MSESGSDVGTRRDLLRLFARNARERAQEVAPLLGEARQSLQAIDLAGGDLTGHTIEAEARADEIATPARAPVRALSVEDLIDVAHSEGLTERDAELRGVAQRSLRMTSTDPAGADAWILTRDAWAAPGGTEALVAQIDLAAAAVHDSKLPTLGWLVLFVEPLDASDESAARMARGVVLDSPAEISPGLEPVGLGAELVMPRLWNAAIQRLELDEAEAEAYVRVRARVHELQGVEDDDDGGLGIAYHRVFGYPNETTGSMPSDCVSGSEQDSHRSESWRLLVQISLSARRRLYIWIGDADLRLGSFEELCAFVR
jgi:hypothetical protein